MTTPKTKLGVYSQAHSVYLRTNGLTAPGATLTLTDDSGLLNITLKGNARSLYPFLAPDQTVAVVLGITLAAVEEEAAPASKLVLPDPRLN